MRAHKWSPEQRVKFAATMRRKRENSKAVSRVSSHSHFYRFKGGQLLPVKVKRMTLLVIE